MVDAALSFHSWVRRGLANAIPELNSLQTTTAAVVVGFNDEGGTPALVANATLELIGPGDIVGLDTNVVVRRWPPADDFDAEFKSYALIEFDQADLLWRYSPEASTLPESQVRPWLTLVVLEVSECTLVPSSPEQRLPILEVRDTNVLPPTADLWAWGHTQFAGENLSEAAIAKAISGTPGQFTGRLMSPRLLQANKDYVACVVPTFERGRLVGLGRLSPEDLTAIRTLWNLADNTDPNDPRFQLPVYYAWNFKTGSLANFEEAARLMRPIVLPKTLGRRDMDVSEPGFLLPAASPDSLPVEGALMSVAAAEAPAPVWPTLDRTAFIAALKELVNAPAEARDPELVPPLYAQWYAASSRLLQASTDDNPSWFFDLNSDPRNRVAAALGTKVIQREQQALLASGWEQIGEAALINDQSRVLQLARGLLGRIFIRHITETSLQRFYLLTLKLHSFVTCGADTVCGNLSNSPIPPGFLSTQWTRWTRPRGPIGLLQGRQQLSIDGFVPDLITRLNNCERPAPEPEDPPKHEPTGPRGGQYCEQVEELVALGSSTLLFWGLLILWVVRQLIVSQNGDCWWIALKALRFAIFLIRIAINPGQVRLVCKLRNFTLTPSDIQNGPRFPLFTANGGGLIPNPMQPPPTPGASDSPDFTAIRAELVRLLGVLAPPPQLTCKPPVPLGDCQEQLVTVLQPELTIGEVFLERRHVEITWEPGDKLEPLFLPPTYERPMYKPLSQISSEWILPGLNAMTRDRVGLAVTNQRFIEGYMAGLNHEMTRELLWNEFPTDQRGTYFRQFWDVAGHMLSDGSKLSPEQLRDIKIMREWAHDAPLGGNSPRPRPNNDPSAEFVVLVVRAQLIQKYPNVIVYAQERGIDGKLGGDQTHPVFYALIDPDTAFYGFPMTIDDVRDSPQLYFVFQEQPGEPKFADENTDRNGALYTNPASPVDLGATAGVVAKSTFLDPFRLGISAQTLLPPPPAP
jgi:hypothetical protein